MQILESLPNDWKVTVTVETGGGRDDWGNPVEGVSTEVEGCLLAPKMVTDENNMTSYADGQAVLHMPKGTVIGPSSKVVTPQGSVVAGSWSVNGEPMFWPHGVEVHLEKEG